MNLLKPGARLRYIGKNDAQLTTFERGKIYHFYRYGTGAISRYISTLEHHHIYAREDQFELVNQETMNKPFVFAEPSAAAQPGNMEFYPVIYIPVRVSETKILKKYCSDTFLFGERVHEAWGNVNHEQTYRFKRQMQPYPTAQQALDAGEAELRKVFQPASVPASSESIRYIDL